jgi:phage terminase large subunit-like protein
VFARDKQLPPTGDWNIWLLLAGRGFGKTRTAAEFVRDQIENHDVKSITFVGRTPAELRDYMIEGVSGILNIYPPDARPLYEPSKSRITWKNGARAILRSSESPDSCRGAASDLIWCDEIAAYKHPQLIWDNLMFGLREGKNPRVVCTTTPRPIQFLKDLIARKDCVTVTGSTYENKDNLAKVFIEQIIEPYAKTRIGRQEIFAEILEDIEGALWKFKLIDDLRVKTHPELKRVVIGVDPAGSANKKADETGIIVVGIGIDEHMYVLKDSSFHGTPEQWAAEVVRLFDLHKADKIIAESNFGGDMVKSSKSKFIRAEPISSIYEQMKAHHVGLFQELENEMCTYTGDTKEKSPNRLDALVFAANEVMLNSNEPQLLFL